MNAKTLALPLAGAAVLAVGAVPAGAAHTAAVSKKAKLTISGVTKVNIGKSITDTLHFGPQAVQIKSGGTLTIVNTTDPAAKGPHSFSIVKKSQLPRTASQVENCAVCGQIAQAHGADPNSPAPPTKLVVDVGAPGFDQPGDSIFIGAKGSTPVKITARKGTVLYYMCAVHAWMQGKVIVR
jgi:plastocyanin